MIYPKQSLSSGAAVKNVYYGRDAIRNIYRKVGDVVKCVYSADLIYVGKRDDTASQALSVARGWANIVARTDIPQTDLAIPGTGRYLHIYIPAAYANSMRIYVNGVLANPTRISSRTYIYNLSNEMYRRTLYYCYAMLVFSTSDGTITFAAEPKSAVTNPLDTLLTTDKTSYVAAINELYTLIHQ